MDDIKIIHIEKAMGTFFLDNFNLEEYHCLNYKNNEKYVIWLKNPISYFVSAFWFSYDIINMNIDPDIIKPKINGNKFAFSKEYNNLINYFKSPNHLAESMTSNNIKDKDMAYKLMNTFNHYINKGIGWHLLNGQFIEDYKQKILFVGRMENMNEDIIKLSKILNKKSKTIKKSCNNHLSHDIWLSKKAIQNIYNHFKETDYKTLEILLKYKFITKEVFEEYHYYEYVIDEFEYITNKINNAKFIKHPFPHLEIRDFLSDEDLTLLLKDKQIHFEKHEDNDELYNTLIMNDWKIQGFPGCVNNWKTYIKSLSGKYKSNDPVQHIGITFRLQSYQNKRNEILLQFLNSDKFHNTLRNKFNIEEKTKIISAIQKNLTGYEISPHPDVRQKSLTYLLNINNDNTIEKMDCHTHLLEFKDKYKYVIDYWKNNKNINRCWIPWDWCNTIKKINKNNTMIIFKPDENPPTLHAIRLKYNHLKFQRTQIYGNLMYTNPIKYTNEFYSDIKPKLK
jgi:hypothetical protein